MVNKTPTAIKINYDSLVVIMKALPELGEEPLNAILGGYLVLNAPYRNKDGSVSKRSPRKFVVLSPDRFASQYAFEEKPQRRVFVPVKVI